MFEARRWLATTILLATVPAVASQWAVEETFDGDPVSPSQALLPEYFDYVATHRTHPQEQFTKAYAPYLADHDENCAGPNPAVSPLPQRLIQTVQTSNGDLPDESFYVCKNHMMTSLGEVDPYSLSSFWPKQDFDFSAGGTLEFEVNINLGHSQRHWWEILITPRNQMRVGPASIESATDERYPADRIVFNFQNLVRHVRVGSGAVDPDGWEVSERQFGAYDWAYWNALHPEDPALSDRRIRRTMRISLDSNEIIWSIETADGRFDEFRVDVPNGLPFTRGLVIFKTHSYTPSKQDNDDTFTFHWDNIRFDGPVVGQYDTYQADDVVYLQANGNRPIGDSQTVHVELPDLRQNPVLFGQINGALTGQAQLSINDSPLIEVNPYEYSGDNCTSGQWQDWKSFRIPLQRDLLQPGINTFRWVVGDRPDCATPDDWDGYSVKFLQIQIDSANAPNAVLFSSGFESSIASSSATAD